MHWIWRAAMAAGVAFILAILFAGVMDGSSRFVIRHLQTLAPSIEIWFITKGYPLCWILPTIVGAVLSFILITHITRLPSDNRETRCRKCGYILKGIKEPRCSECGERI